MSAPDARSGAHHLSVSISSTFAVPRFLKTRSTIAAAEVGLALAIVLRVFRNRGTANVDELDTLKW